MVVEIGGNLAMVLLVFVGAWAITRVLVAAIM